MNTAHITIEPEPSSPSQNVSINTIKPEPPPSHSVYNPPNQEETQWIDDAQHSATLDMARISKCNAAHQNNTAYTPRIKYAIGTTRLDAHILSLQQHIAAQQHKE